MVLLDTGLLSPDRGLVFIIEMCYITKLGYVGSLPDDESWDGAIDYLEQSFIDERMQSEVSPSNPQGNAAASPPAEAQSITVRFGRNALIGSPDAPEFTLRMSDATITLNIIVEPVGVEGIPQWSSSDASIFEVTPTAPEAYEATVRAIGRGRATLTITVGNVSQEVYAIIA